MKVAHRHRGWGRSRPDPHVEENGLQSTTACLKLSANWVAKRYAGATIYDHWKKPVKA